MAELLSWISYSPLVAMLLLGAIAFITPPVFEQLRLPSVVGLLLLGSVFGPHGLKAFAGDSAMFQAFAEVGKYALMFLVALELDFSDIGKLPQTAIVFGLASAGFPLLGGAAIGYWVLNLGPVAAWTLGALLTSHTLLTYGLVQRLGVSRNKVVVTTVGATVMTDAIALLILAICLILSGQQSLVAGEASSAPMLLLSWGLAKFGLYCLVSLLGLNLSGRFLLKRAGQREETQMLVVLWAIVGSGLISWAMGINSIFGAFLAGLAVNDALGNGVIKERTALFGSALLVPIFYVVVGVSLDLNGLRFSLTDNLAVTLQLLAVLLGGKVLAAVLVRSLGTYSWAETCTMAFLTFPQVATTLTAALVAQQAGLLPPDLFYSIITLVVVTCGLGPLLVRRAASLLPPQIEDETQAASSDPSEQPWAQKLSPQAQLPAVKPAQSQDLEPEQDAAPASAKQAPAAPLVRVLVPVHNPSTQANLLSFAMLLPQRHQGVIIPFAIANARSRMDQPELLQALSRSQQLLIQSVAQLESESVSLETLLRIDDDVPEGISRAAKEKDVDVIVLGWSELDLRSRLLGNVTSRVFSTAHCPVVVTRLLKPAAELKRILVPVKAATPAALRLIRLALLIAQNNGAAVKLLHVCDRSTPLAQIRRLEDRLARALGRSIESEQLLFRTMIHRQPDQAILKAAEGYDLLMLRSIRRRTAGGMTVGDTTTNIIRVFRQSIVLFGEPRQSPRR